jgi:5'-methylthioadenosine phosphorylase
MKLGVIGGSGLYDIEGLAGVRTRTLTTPFGAPSDAFVCGRIGPCAVYFLPRHGKGHRLLPSEINHKANIYAFKKLGVERIVSISAVGSLREDLRPRDIVLPDQYYDRTKAGLAHTFFGQGVVAHISFGEPTCPEMRAWIAKILTGILAATPEYRDLRLNNGGTYINMEGPAFSTRAESNVYRRLGFDVIGMTSLAEAKLCREAEICYQPIAMVTDYDCWHASEEEVSVELIIANLLANAALAKKAIRELAIHLPARRQCACGSALKNAVITAPAAIPPETRKRLELLLEKYLPRA